MGFGNPPVAWQELEARLSGRIRPFPAEGDGGDSPAWSYHRQPYQPPTGVVRGSRRSRTPSCTATPTSASSTGRPTPRSWSRRRPGSGLEALAITDHDGMYGVVRFAEAARAVGMPTVFGAELSLGLTRPQNGVADPEGTHLRGPGPGSHRLHPAVPGPLGGPSVRPGERASRRSTSRPSPPSGPGRSGPRGHVGRPEPELSLRADHWLVLTGCRKGIVPAALVDQGPGRGRRRAGRLQTPVRPGQRGGGAVGPRRPARLGPQRRPGRSWPTGPQRRDRGDQQRPLPPSRPGAGWPRLWPRCGPGAAWTRSTAGCRRRPPPTCAAGPSKLRRFARYPGVVERAAELGRACAFDLALVAPNLPPWPTPPGHTEMSWLRHLTEEGAVKPLRPPPRRPDIPGPGPRSTTSST